MTGFDAEVLAALHREQPCTPELLAGRLSCGLLGVKGALGRLRRRGLIQGHGEVIRTEAGELALEAGYGVH